MITHEEGKIEHTPLWFKLKAMEAYDLLIEKFRNPSGRDFNRPSDCPFCHVYLRLADRLHPCVGCPFADEDGDIGCADFDAIDNLKIVTFDFGKYYEGDYNHDLFKEEFESIASLLEENRELLNTMPKALFHPATWEPLNIFDKFKKHEAK